VPFPSVGPEPHTDADAVWGFALRDQDIPMPARARPKVPGKRRAVSSTRLLTSKRRAKSPGGTARRRQARRRPLRGDLKRQAAEEQRALGDLFQEQVGPLWSRFGNECRQFADAFNAEWGSPMLQIEFGSDVVMVKFASGGEVLVQLVRENQHVFCVMTSGCTDMGACCVDQLPLGLSIADGRLGFMYGADARSEDSLAVKLLTDLVQMNTPGGAAAPDTPPSR
jgi:hypothetical protein